MNNNKMISVPRELLNRVATEANHMLGFTSASNYDEFRSAVDELRALLDAPAVERKPYAYAHEWASWISSEGPKDFKPAITREAPPQWAIESGQARNVIELYETPAAQPQPQGEPVVFVAQGSLDDPQCVGMHATRKPNELQHVALYAEPFRWFYAGVAYTHKPHTDAIALYTEQLAPFQSRVQPWMLACFGEAIAEDRQERNHRFLEEALELVQACGATSSEAHQLVDYVYGRPVGEPSQEVGGVMVTLAALCLARGIDMHAAGETELARIWTKVEQIRAKQAAKPAPVAVALPEREYPVDNYQDTQRLKSYAQGWNDCLGQVRDLTK